MGHLLTAGELDRIDRDTAIIFDHIQKCGGSSLILWLQFTLGRQVLSFNTNKTYLDGPAWTEDERCVFCGHFTRGLHAFLPADRTAAYVTFLRDPLATALSTYKFSRNQVTIDTQMDLTTFLLEYPPNPFVMHLGNGSLEAAQKTLFEDYCAFGLVERYAASLAYFCLKVFKYDRIMPCENKSNVSESRTLTVDPELAAHFRKINAADYALYACACAEFDRRLGTLPPDLDTATALVKPAALTVDHIESYQDVTAALECGNRRQAMALLLDRHFDSIQYHNLKFACGLAMSINAMAEAGRFFEKLLAAEPYYHTGLYVTFLLATDRADQAVAWVEAECRRYDRYPHIPPGSDLFLFRIGSLCQLLRTRQAATGRLDTALLDRLVADCRATREGSGQLVGTLLAMFQYEAVIALCQGTEDSSPRLLLPEAERLTVLALALFQTGRIEAADALAGRILADNPYEGAIWRLRIVIDKKRGGGHLDPAAVRDVTQRFAGSRFSALILKELAVNRYEAGFSDEALALLDQAGLPEKERLIESAGREQEMVPFDAVALDGALIVKTGPRIVFDAVCRHFCRPGHTRFDLLGDPGPDARERLGPALGRCFPLPPGRYVHARHFAALADLAKTPYRCCLVLMSDYFLDAYTEILKLVDCLTTQAIYLYSFDHLLSTKYRHVLMRYHKDLVS